MRFRTKLANQILLTLGTTIAAGIGAATVSNLTDGSIARVFGALTIGQIHSANTEIDDSAGIGQGVPYKTSYKCKEKDRVLLSCSAYTSPAGAQICDAVVGDDGKGGVCFVGTCQGVPNQRWRVTLTCLKR
jgi:hypothetical protein